MSTRKDLYVVFSFILFTSIPCYKGKEENRRILLDDPNYVFQHELSTLKAMVQEQQSKIAEMENKLKTEQATIQTILQQQTTGYGAVYTRWGRKQCPDNTTELVYSGIVGGSKYDQTSAAAEYVCLPTDPIWAKYDESVVNYHAKMYGAEYEENFFKTGLVNNDVPCAVCRRQSASAAILLPGRTQCYPGWKTEYYGYLSSGAYAHIHKAATQFVCLDINPEVVFHSSRDDDGKLFYMVEAICGALSCPPYVNGRELTCAVCTK